MMPPEGKRRCATIMTDSLSDLILSLAPEDGSTIGNGAMKALLRERVPGLTDDDYDDARDALVDDGRLSKGRGRGGSIYRPDVAEMALDHTEEPTAPKAVQANGKARKQAAKSDGPKQVVSYRYGEMRVNNPEVGMVHAKSDPDGPRTQWAYDPHLDPVLNFDPARADVEALIDDALASNDPERMREALAELKRMQAPYLQWTGKAERTSFEVDTVSLHVHERVDPATILANAARRLKGGGAVAAGGPLRCALREPAAAPSDRLLPARERVVEPPGDGGQPAGNELATHQGGHGRQGADDLRRPALRY